MSSAIPRARSSSSRAKSRGLFGLQVLFGVESPLHGEAAGLGHDVEVCPALDSAPQHQDRVRGGLRDDPIMRPALLHLGLENLQRPSHLQHLLERIDPLMLQSHVGGLPFDRDAQRDGATVGIPDHAAGGLRREHGHAVLSQQADLVQIARAALPAGLLVGHDAEPDATLQGNPALLEQRGGVDHARHARPSCRPIRVRSVVPSRLAE